MRTMRLRKRIINRKGFSLTELLAAVLILSMVSAVVAGGIPVARDAYEKVTVSANAQVMLSTAISALRNELCTASKVNEASILPDNTLEYYSASMHSTSRVLYDESDNCIKLIRFWGTSSQLECDLVSDAAGGNKVQVICNSITYDKENGIAKFTGLRVVDKTNKDKIYAKLQGGTSSTLDIRVIAD